MNIQEALDELKLIHDKETRLKEARKKAQLKYNLTEKGKKARSRSYKKNYVPTGKPRGRPKKSNL